MDRYKLLRETVVKKIVVDTAISREVVNKVIDHQMKGIVKALETPGINSVEISGFGTFVLGKNLARRTVKGLLTSIKDYEEKLAKGMSERASAYYRILKNDASENINYIMNKIGEDTELGTDLRRLAKSSDSPEEA